MPKRAALQLQGLIFCGVTGSPKACQTMSRGCSYDGHWRLTWSLILGLVRLVEVHASWPGHPR